ncbi:hypothetical protein Patl1_20670 [Pistacia atlantica]|uniref:Uncharacterized protein n=1 Tax=Pistacia atlantica TaxID=434234 RepID=A0ACC1BKD2_9ROSI|nr:hypothetical protein Patl1_20670 [Pistacia atlantica]
MDATERETKSWNADCISIENNKSSVQIKVLFFARAGDLIGLSDLPLELVAKFPSLEEEEYANDSMIVIDKDELWWLIICIHKENRRKRS